MVAQSEGAGGFERRRVLAELRSQMFGASPLLIADRYELRSVLGSGGMGVVHSAFDRRLKRMVALKVLHPDRRDADTGHRRLRREARALSRLTHPNVVEIYDIGMTGGQVFIAMQLVDGHALDVWLREESPGLPAILAVFIAAGRGLAAAHDEAGLVHRDFKPANVLVGRHGSVKVADFGLARSSRDRSAPGGASRVSEATTTTTGSGTGTQLTADGVQPGTPRYMAPEQRRGESCDARADQFAFCVALFEAAFGVHPFGDALQGVEERDVIAIARPKLASTSHNRLFRVLRRGLAHDPENRYPSMAGLLAEVERIGRPRKTLWLLACAPLPLASLLATGPHIDCKAAGNSLRSQWDQHDRHRLEAMFAALPEAWAMPTWVRIAPQVDAYVEHWGAAHAATCELLRQEASVTRSALDHRASCLDRSRNALHTTLEVLATGDSETAKEAVTLVSALPAVERCTTLDASATTQTFDLPPSHVDANAVADLRGRLDRVATLTRAKTQLDDAVAEGLAIEQAAQALQWQPLITKASFAVGAALGVSGQLDEALPRLRAAAHTFAELGDDESAARAWVALLQAREGTHSLDPQLAKLDVGAALTAARRQGDIAMLVRAHLNAGGVLTSIDDHEEAVAHHRRAQALLSQLDQPDPLLELDVDRALGVSLYGLGDYTNAAERFEAAVERTRAAYGERHPTHIAALAAHGGILGALGRQEQAAEVLAQAIAAFRDSGASETPELALMLMNRAAVLGPLQRRDESLEHVREARRILESRLGPTHPQLAHVLSLEGIVLSTLGETEASIAALQRALAIVERVYEPNHRQVGEALLSLGDSLHYLGRDREAERHLARAQQVFETALGYPHPRLVAVLSTRVYVARNLGRFAEAEALARQTLNMARTLELYDRAAEAEAMLAKLRERRSSGSVRRHR